MNNIKKYAVFIFILFTINTNAQNVVFEYEYIISDYDSSKKIVVYNAYKKRDSAIVVLDSSKTIIQLVDFFTKNYKKQNEIYYLKIIFSFINKKGYVLKKDKIKFNKAVKDYHDLINK